MWRMWRLTQIDYQTCRSQTPSTPISSSSYFPKQYRIRSFPMRVESKSSTILPCPTYRLGYFAGAFAIAVILVILVLFGYNQAPAGWSTTADDQLADAADCKKPTAPPPSPVEPPEHRYEIADCHLHLVDFLQQTEGIHAAMQAMDRAGVKECKISGMPLVVTWTHDAPIRPTYYLDSDTPCYWYSATDVLVARELLKLSEKERSRFFPFICGFNPTDRNAVDHVKRMIEWYPGLWKGIGEVMTRHDDLSNLVPGEKGRADHIALDPIYELAAEHGLPVSIHSNISSVWKREPIYLKELKNALAKHPKTRFIWCHAGISRRVEVPDLPRILAEMLKAHSNLHIDLSWVVYDTQLVINGKADRAWVKLVNDHPDRFMIGSDAVGKFGRYRKDIHRYEIFLDALEPETAKKVARDNFVRLMPKSGAYLKKAEKTLK